MKVTIHFRTDLSTIPYCAYIIEPIFHCRWSAKSFEEAERVLLEDLLHLPLVSPPSKTVEILDGMVTLP